MNWANILIILGCLGGGYWLVSSIMGPGVDITKATGGDQPEPPPLRDWHLILDIPSDSSRREIQAALKRRLAQLDTGADRGAAERLRRAAEAGLRQAR